MPNASEIATVSAGGQTYSFWKSIEVSRVYGMGVAEARLAVAEPSDPDSGGFPALQLAPGDTASVTLAGRPAIKGYVWLRQAYYDAEEHGVEIGVASPLLDAVVSSVDGNPGEYQNYTLAQIASAVLGKVGVGFQIVGSPAAADKIFPLVRENKGETRFGFVERLCRIRNLHLVDDGQGNLVASRGVIEGVIATLKEGNNIKRARLILKNDEMADPIQLNLQSPGTDQNWSDGARDVAATASIPGATRFRPMTVVGEHPGDKQDAAMRVNHERDWFVAQYMDGTITVHGWLLGDGTLWMEHVGAQVKVDSPMLIPGGEMTIYLKGVVHRQNDRSGTETDLILSNIPSGGDPVTFGGWSDPTALGSGAPAAPDVGQ
jgi:prophage tail gpP-like protein